MKKNNKFHMALLSALCIFSTFTCLAFKGSNGLVADIPTDLRWCKEPNEPFLSFEKNFIVIGNSIYPINFKDIDATVKIYNSPTYVDDVLVEHRGITDTDETLLIRACAEKDINAVDYLVKCGANVNKQVKSCGYTPLLHACANNSFDLIRILLNAGANVNIETGKEDSVTPLILVAFDKDAFLVNFLISQGADLEKSIKIGEKQIDTIRRLYGKEDAEYVSDAIDFLKKFVK